MGYFDDPQHRAQWEKELTALRVEKARIKEGLQPISEQAERAVSKNIEKSAPQKDISYEETTEIDAEEKTFFRPSEEFETEREQDNYRENGTYRVKTSFKELLREENMEKPVRLTQKPRELERQKEVSYEL